MKNGRGDIAAANADGRRGGAARGGGPFLRPGCAVARAPLDNWSSIACLAREKGTGRLAAIGSAHALAGPGCAIGGAPGRALGAAIWVRGRRDRPPVEIGSIAHILFGAEGDAALVALSPGLARRIETALPHMPARLDAPARGRVLCLEGRRSARTDGQVADVGVFSVRHGARTVAFEGFRLDPVPGRTGYRLCAPGDSGGLWRDRARNIAVGIHVAGGRDARTGRPYALACRLDMAAAAFDAEVFL